MKTILLFVLLFTSFWLRGQIPIAVNPALSCPEFSILSFGQFVSNCAPTGQIVFTVDGEYGSYIQYSINDGVSWSFDNQFIGLSQGYYKCKIKVNINGQTCIKDYALNPVRVTYLDFETQYWDPITQELITVGKNLIDTVLVTNPLTCAATGSIQVIKTGSPNGGEYSLDGVNFQVSNTFSGLSVGIYNVFIRKPGSTCMVQYRNQVSIWPKGFIDTYSVVSEYGCETGKITFAASPSSGLEYSINNGATWSFNNAITGLSPGTYIPKFRKSACILALPDIPFIIIGNFKPQIFDVVFTPGPCDGNGNVAFKMFLNSPYKSINDINQVSVSSDNINFTTIPNSPDVNYDVPTNTSAIYIKVRYGPIPYQFCTYVFSIPSTHGLLPNVLNSSENPQCLMSNGNITFTPPDGKPYFYSINNGSTWQTSPIFNNVGPGNYNLIYKRQDVNCISDAKNVILVNENIPPQIVNVISANISDCGLTNGSITINSISGTGAVQFSINNGIDWSANNLFNNLNTGNYQIVIRNQNATCLVTYPSNPVVITAPLPPVINSVNSSNVTDCGAMNGSISINAAAGSGNILYSINNGNTWQLSNVFPNLNGGNYQVKIKNENGTCIQNYVSNPVIITTPIPPIINQVTFSNTTDCNLNNGIISIASTAGSSSTQYSIDNGINWSNSGNFSNLSPGSYNIKLRNINQTCIVNYVNNPVVLPGHIGPMITTVISTDVSDCGLINGQITINATAGESALQYSINNGTNWSSSNIFNNLNQGNYQIKVRNNNGTCAVNYNLNPLSISAPVSPELLNIVKNNVTDCGLNNGSILISANPGSSPLQYSIDNGNTWFASSNFANLASGNYNGRIRNNNGTCIVNYVSNPIVITGPTAPQFTTVNSTNASDCQLSNGSISIVAQPGSSPLQYSITNGDQWANNGSFTNLTQGSYLATIRNNDATCVVNFPSNPVVITAPSAPSITGINTIQPTDCSNPTGNISITFTSGSGSPQFTKDAGNTWQNNATFSNLPAGQYFIGIRNPDGSCSNISSSPTVINQLALPLISQVQSEGLIGCTSGLASITINASGSNGQTLLYSINGGLNYQNSNVFMALGAGSYNVKVKYINANCELNYTQNPVVLNFVPAPIIQVVNIIQPISCENSNTGSISISSYDINSLTLLYSLNNGSNWSVQPNFTNLSVGNYQIAVKNSLGCQTNYPANPVQLIAPSQPSLLAVQIIKTPDCGTSNGELMATFTSSQSVEFSINNGITWQESPMFNGLTSGNHYLKIRNANGQCENSFFQNPIVIGSVIDFHINDVSIIQPTSCELPNGELIVNVNEPQLYQYSINGGINFSDNFVFSNLSSGVYQIVVKKKVSNCILNYSNPITLIAPESPQIVSLEIKQPDCGSNFGSIACAANKPNVEYSIDGINWQVNPLFNNLPTGVYTLRIRNVDGSCENLYDELVTLNSSATFNISNVEIVENSNCQSPNGSIEIITGTSGLEYSIDDGMNFQADPHFEGLGGGSYRIKVKDPNTNCIVTYPVDVIVGSPSGPKISMVDLVSTSNCEGLDAYIQIFAEGTGLEFSIDGGLTWANSSLFKDLGIGDYKVAIRNSGCISLGQEYHFEAYKSIELLSKSVHSPEKCDVNDGSIELNANYPEWVQTYSIDGGLTTQSVNIFNDLSIGTYEPLLTSVDGCSFVFKQIFLYPSAALLLDSVVVINPESCQDSFGNIKIFAGPEFNFSIDGGLNWQNNSEFIGIQHGIYNLLVKDIENCTYVWPKDIEIISGKIPIITEVLSSTELNCTNGFGKITVIASGDNYVYSIDNGVTFQNTPSFDHLSDGIYSIIIKDTLGNCISDTLQKNINFSTPQLLYSDVAIENITNCKPANGKIIFELAEDLLFSIDGGKTWSQQAEFHNLSAGNYNVLTKNKITNCISEPLSIVLDLPGNVVTNIHPNTLEAICGDNGRIDLGLTSPGLMFSINSGLNWQPEFIFDNLASGNYEVRIRNVDGCIFAPGIPVTITQNNTFAAEIIEVKPPTCEGMNDGIIKVDFPDNIDPLVLIKWPDGSGGKTFSGPSGIVNLKAVLGTCTLNQNYEILPSPQSNIEWVNLSDTVLCAPSGVNYTFDDNTLTFLWSQNGEIIGDQPQINISEIGDVALQISDQRGCILEDNWTINLAEKSNDYDFIVAGEGVINIPIIAVDVTWPIPDSLHWIIESSYLIQSREIENQFHMIFDTPGSYNVGLLAYSGNCVVLKEKQFRIFGSIDSLSFPIQNLGLESLLSMDLRPNPNNGIFKVNFEYLQPIPGKLYIFNNSGDQIFYKELNPLFALDEIKIELPSRTPGGIYSLIYTNRNGQFLWRNFVIIN
jgi:hypothetical protein